jgi:hypothetical protein
METLAEHVDGNCSECRYPDQHHTRSGRRCDRRPRRYADVYLLVRQLWSVLIVAPMLCHRSGGSGAYVSACGVPPGRNWPEDELQHESAGVPDRAPYKQIRCHRPSTEGMLPILYPCAAVSRVDCCPMFCILTCSCGLLLCGVSSACTARVDDRCMAVIQTSNHHAAIQMP